MTQNENNNMHCCKIKNIPYESAFIRPDLSSMNYYYDSSSREPCIDTYTESAGDGWWIRVFRGSVCEQTQKTEVLWAPPPP